MKKHVVIAVLCSLVSVWIVGSIGADSTKPEPKKPEPRKEGDPKKVHLLMQRKLQTSQQLLEAITLNDRKSIRKYGESLVAITKEPEWKVFKTEEYETFSGEFRRAAEALAEKAKDKNVDGAGLAYLELTLSCLNCHKYMRDQR